MLYIMGRAAEFDQQFFKGHRTKQKLSAKSAEGTREGRTRLRKGGGKRQEEITGQQSGGCREGEGRRAIEKEMLHEEKTGAGYGDDGDREES